jgi:hypothetical protein
MAVLHNKRLVIGTSRSKEICEDNFRFWWRRVHEDASQGMYMSKIEICFFTARILQKKYFMFGRTCEIKRKMYHPGLSLTWVPVWDSAHQVHSRVSNVNFVLCGREALEIFPVCSDVNSITSGFGGGEFTKTLRKVCTCQKLKFAFLLLEYCKIRECYAVANAFTIRNMHSLLLYMNCNSRKINRPTAFAMCSIRTDLLK